MRGGGVDDTEGGCGHATALRCGRRAAARAMVPRVKTMLEATANASGGQGVGATIGAHRSAGVPCRRRIGGAQRHHQPMLTVVNKKYLRTSFKTIFHCFRSSSLGY